MTRETPDGSSLERVLDRLERFRSEREWEEFHTLKDLTASITIEAAELQEWFLWKSDAEGDSALADRRDEIESELADVMIQCLNFAQIAKIDVIDAIERKIDLNERRYPVERARGSAAKYTELE